VEKAVIHVTLLNWRNTFNNSSNHLLIFHLLRVGVVFTKLIIFSYIFGILRGHTGMPSWPEDCENLFIYFRKFLKPGSIPNDTD